MHYKTVLKVKNTDFLIYNLDVADIKYDINYKYQELNLFTNSSINYF